MRYIFKKTFLIYSTLSGASKFGPYYFVIIQEYKILVRHRSMLYGIILQIFSLSVWQIVSIQIIAPFIHNVLWHQHQLFRTDRPPVVFCQIPRLGSYSAYCTNIYKFQVIMNKHTVAFFHLYYWVRLSLFNQVLEVMNSFFNVSIKGISAKEVYAKIINPLFGEGVLYDCPDHMLQK